MNARQFEVLTPTERRVLRLVHHSRKSEAIADAIGISRHTVDQHIKAARGKMGNVGRYVAADMLRAHEEAHPSPLGKGSLGIAESNTPAPSTSQPESTADTMKVAEERASFQHHTPDVHPGQVENPSEWLQRTSQLSRLVLVLAAAFILLVLIVSAPLLVAQMGRIGRPLYQ